MDAQSRVHRDRGRPSNPYHRWTVDAGSPRGYERMAVGRVGWRWASRGKRQRCRVKAGSPREAWGVDGRMVPRHVGTVHGSVPRRVNVRITVAFALGGVQRELMRTCGRSFGRHSKRGRTGSGCVAVRRGCVWRSVGGNGAPRGAGGDCSNRLTVTLRHLPPPLSSLARCFCLGS